MPATPAVPNAKRPTLADVASRAGVSTALVSIVMRGAKGAGEATRERVLQAAREIGYRPDARARLLRSHRSHLLGVQFGLQHPFHSDLVEGIYAAAEPAGYQIALSAVAAGRGEQRAVETLLDDRCEALILLGPQAPPRGWQNSPGDCRSSPWPAGYGRPSRAWKSYGPPTTREPARRWTTSSLWATATSPTSTAAGHRAQPTGGAATAPP